MTKRLSHDDPKYGAGCERSNVRSAANRADIAPLGDAAIPLSRRDALRAAAMAAAFTIVPRHVLGGPGQKPPSETLGVAVIGCGNQGRGNPLAATDERLVALCDVDEAFIAQSMGPVMPLRRPLEALPTL